MDKMTIAIIGAGERGRRSYARYLLEKQAVAKVVAVADPSLEKRADMQKDHGVTEEKSFKSWQAFFAEEKMCDAVFICTNDDMHYEPTRVALERGYHVLLEKPMSNKIEEIRELGALAEKYKNQVFMVCHVLRYTPFFEKIKEIIGNGTIGELINIQHNENIGHFHMAHSYVRGNWKDSNETSPIILAKSCHDLDILVYLTGTKAKKISSFGSLKHFKKECSPEGAAKRCLYCSIEASCPYSAKKNYKKSLGGWPTSVFYEGTSEKELEEVLATSPYGKCVYHCDNNVMDHQVTIIEFENDVTATFNLSAFTQEITRTIKIMGTHGEIRGAMEKNVVDVHYFLTGEVVSYDTSNYTLERYAHGGGDAKIIEDFLVTLTSYKKGEIKEAKTSAVLSVESHLMAFAAEEARLTNQVMIMDEYRRRR